MNERTIKLSKKHQIFNSIQGEGLRTGTLATFIRTVGCNLTCQWCDTKYSWDRTHPEFGFDEMTPEELADKVINEYGRQPNLVFTGGEPLLQIVPLMEARSHILRKGYYGKITPHFTIETNGTKWHDLLQEFNLISCSPKPWRLHDDKKVLERMISLLQPEVQLKVVVSDVDELELVIDYFDDWVIGTAPNVSFIIQPETGLGKSWFKKVVNEVRAIGTGDELLTRLRVLPQTHALLEVE